MNSWSADNARETGHAVKDLLATCSRISPQPSPTTGRWQQYTPKKKNGGYKGSQYHFKSYNTINSTNGTNKIVDDTLVAEIDQRHDYSSSKRDKQELDFHTSTWKSVETMVRVLTAGHSVVSTISKCYSLPELEISDQGVHHRRLESDGTRKLTPLFAERLAVEALAVFQKLGQAPTSQPDRLFINFSKMPEALQAIDPGLDNAKIAAWMKGNGFDKDFSATSTEALSWTEYRRALSELCPVFTDTAEIPTSPSQKRRSHTPTTLQTSSERAKETEDKAAPGSPGVDSYSLLQRKRQAAISIDYESATRKIPQGIPPIDPILLVDYIKTQGRVERKTNTREGDDFSLWTLEPHERLTRMILQKSKVSETANPRQVQSRHDLVRVRSRRNEFFRRKDVEDGIASRFSRNIGVISRNENMVQAREAKQKRLAHHHRRVQSEMPANTKSLTLAQRRAEHRSPDRRLKMDRLKCINVNQLLVIQQNEARTVEQCAPKRPYCVRRKESTSSRSSGELTVYPLSYGVTWTPWAPYCPLERKTPLTTTPL